ncbi:MAG: universal stress protein [Chitinophaga sp.]|uniref:universal stress protein n=1 Tax=Chitinophaga sp. TaxID=1869181 RepID=UPI0025BCCEBB|nr:universal stress protein [Chitinophaga sp.]MBV8251897.1 universal stress protein [Chitinophaga sp.]
MEKILFVTDAMAINEQALDFATFLCNLTHSKLTGVFLENMEYEGRASSKLKEIAGAPTHMAVHDIKTKCCEENIQLFKTACESRGISSIIHRDRGIPLYEIVKESKYADLLLIDAELSFENQQESIPTKLVQHLLMEAACPVIITPVGFEGIEQIIFAYDGHPSAILAIKQFTHLFPQFSQQPVNIITVNNEHTVTAEEKHQLKEWLREHYNQVDFTERKGIVKTELLEYVLNKKNAFLVMGAYGRSTISNMLKSSHATPILRMTNQPVFICHS